MFYNKANPIIVLFFFTTISLFFLPYALGGIHDYEDLNSTILTTQLFIKAIAAGKSPFWTPYLGLGLPQPFRIFLGQHPLAFLYICFSPLVATKIILFVHLIIGVISTFYLSRYLGNSVKLSVVCSATWLLSGETIEYLYHDDWPSHLLMWSEFPLILLLSFILLHCEPGRRLVSSISLGCLIGFEIITGHQSYVLTHLILISAVFILHWKLSIEIKRYLLIAAVISIAIGSQVVTLLLSELFNFPPGIAREVHSQPTIAEQIWSVFLRPLWPIGLSYPPGIKAAGLRTVWFGSVFALIALVGLLFPRNYKKLPIAQLTIISIILAAIPPFIYLNITTSPWIFFRDGITLFSILLAANTLRHVSLNYVNMLLFLQIFTISMVGYQELSRVVDVIKKQNSHLLHSHSELVQNDHLDSIITRARTSNNDRVYVSQQLSAKKTSEITHDVLWRYGLVDNAFAFREINSLNAWARGIATSSIYPDRALMEGVIGAEQVAFSNSSMLDILGISIVIATQNETLPTKFIELDRLGDSELNGLRILKNPDSWPSAVFVKPEITDLKLSPLQACPHNRLLCMNFNTLEPYRLVGDVQVDHSYGTTTLRFAPSNSDRTIMLTDWFHTGWRPSNLDVKLFKIVENLIGIIVPKNVDNIRLTYWPWNIVLSMLLSTTVLYLSLIYLLFCGGRFLLNNLR